EKIVTIHRGDKQLVSITREGAFASGPARASAGRNRTPAAVSEVQPAATPAYPPGAPVSVPFPAGSPDILSLNDRIRRCEAMWHSMSSQASVGPASSSQTSAAQPPPAQAGTEPRDYVTWPARVVPGDAPRLQMQGELPPGAASAPSFGLNNA